MCGGLFYPLLYSSYKQNPRPEGIRFSSGSLLGEREQEWRPSGMHLGLSVARGRDSYGHVLVVFYMYFTWFARIPPEGDKLFCVSVFDCFGPSLFRNLARSRTHVPRRVYSCNLIPPKPG